MTTERRQTRTRRHRIARFFSEVRRRALWITAPRQTGIRWHDRRQPLAVGTVLEVHHFDEIVQLGFPGSPVLSGEPLLGYDLARTRMVKVVEVSNGGTEAEVRPTLTRRTRKTARQEDGNT